ALLQVVADGGVEAELGAEVVVERTGRDAGLRRQLGDGGRLEARLLEVVHGGLDQPGLRRPGDRDPLPHTRHRNTLTDWHNAVTVGRMKLSYIYVSVPDLKEALVFYRDELGLDEAWREGESTVA